MKKLTFLIFIITILSLFNNTFATYNEEFKNRGFTTDGITINKSSNGGIGTDGIIINKENGGVGIGVDDNIIITKPNRDENKIIKISNNLNVEGGFGKPSNTDELIIKILNFIKIIVIIIILGLFIFLSIATLLLMINISNVEKLNFYKEIIIKILIAFLFFSGFAIPTYLWIINITESNVKQNKQINSEGLNIKLIK